MSVLYFKMICKFLSNNYCWIELYSFRFYSLATLVLSGKFLSSTHINIFFSSPVLISLRYIWFLPSINCVLHVKNSVCNPNTTRSFWFLVKSEENISSSLHVWPEIWKITFLFYCHSCTVSPLYAYENWFHWNIFPGWKYLISSESLI